MWVKLNKSKVYHEYLPPALFWFLCEKNEIAAVFIGPIKNFDFKKKNQKLR